MRIAIVSDIHGNQTAFEAVLADLRQTSPDLILHGGDLADTGSSPVDLSDRRFGRLHCKNYCKKDHYGICDCCEVLDDHVGERITHY
jgi:3',5'-cyclic AMP phosphodiesterase CpdA